MRAERWAQPPVPGDRAPGRIARARVSAPFQASLRADRTERLRTRGPPPPPPAGTPPAPLPQPSHARAAHSQAPQIVLLREGTDTSQVRARAPPPPANARSAVNAARAAGAAFRNFGRKFNPKMRTEKNARTRWRARGRASNRAAAWHARDGEAVAKRAKGRLTPPVARERPPSAR